MAQPLPTCYLVTPTLPPEDRLSVKVNLQGTQTTAGLAGMAPFASLASSSFSSMLLSHQCSPIRALAAPLVPTPDHLPYSSVEFLIPDSLPSLPPHPISLLRMHSVVLPCNPMTHRILSVRFRPRKWEWFFTLKLEAVGCKDGDKIEDSRRERQRRAHPQIRTVTELLEATEWRP